MALDDIVFQTSDAASEGQSFELEVLTQSIGQLTDINTGNQNVDDVLVNELNKPTLIVDNRRKVR